MPPLPWPNSRVSRLAICLAALALVWLGLLPLLANHPDVESHIRRNERLGVDPSAKFYTELPAMPRLLQRVRHRSADARHR